MRTTSLLRRMLTTTAAAAVACALVACSSDLDDTTGTDDATGTTVATTADPTSPGTAASDDSVAPAASATSIVGLLGRVPASSIEAGDSAYLVYGDLDRASELAGVTRPAHTAEDRDVAHWGVVITGLNGDPGDVPVAALAPAPVSRGFDQASEIVADVGWSPADIGAFLSEESPPSTFVVMSGPNADDLTAVLGEPVDGVWRIGDGDDYTVHPSARTPVRVLGAPLNEAVADGLLAVTPSTPMITGWLAGTEPSLAGDPALLAVATALDESDVYAALLSVPDAPAADDVNPFDAVGVGLGLDGTGAYATFVYHYGTDHVADAVTAAEALHELVLTGSSFRTRAPWSEIFTYDAISVQGDVVVMRLRFVADRRPDVVWGVFAARDALVARGSSLS